MKKLLFSLLMVTVAIACSKKQNPTPVSPQQKQTVNTPTTNTVIVTQTITPTTTKTASTITSNLIGGKWYLNTETFLFQGKDTTAYKVMCLNFTDKLISTHRYWLPDSAKYYWFDSVTYNSNSIVLSAAGKVRTFTVTVSGTGYKLNNNDTLIWYINRDSI